MLLPLLPADAVTNLVLETITVPGSVSEEGAAVVVEEASSEEVDDLSLSVEVEDAAEELVVELREEDDEERVVDDLWVVSEGLTDGVGVLVASTDLVVDVADNVTSPVWGNRWSGSFAA